MLRLKHTFVEIAFLNTILFLIGCSSRQFVDKNYTEDVYGKRKHLFSEYDTGKKYEKGFLNISLTNLSNLDQIKDVFNDTLVSTNTVNTLNTFYQNSTIYETTNTTNIRLLYQFSNSVGIGVGASISKGNNDVVNNSYMAENITDWVFLLRYGREINENIHAIIGLSLSSYNLKSAIEIIEESDQSVIYSYTTDYKVPNNKITFTINRKLNEYNHVFIGAQSIVRIYKLVPNKNIEGYNNPYSHVQGGIKSHSNESMLYGYLGWEGSIKILSQRNTLSICLGHPLFYEKQTNGGLTLGVKLTTSFHLN